MSEKNNRATAAVKWAFPDRGRETDMMRAVKVVEEAVAETIRNQV